MNRKFALVVVALLAGAGLLMVAALSGAAPELTVAHVLNGDWPPKGADPAKVAATDIAMVGYCLEVDDPVRPSRIRLGATPPGDRDGGFDQPGVWVDVEPSATRPDEVRVRSWTRVRGRLDPQTNRFKARQVEAKCPSAEQAKEKATP